MTASCESPRIGSLIPVRLGSERLPRKQLYEVCGRPLLYHLLDRVAACRHIRSVADIVVCTTEDPSDDPLEDVVAAYGARLFRGARDDIIGRFAAAMDAFGFDYVVQANGDNVFTDTGYMTRGIDLLLADPGVDVTTCVGLPIGISSTCFTRAAMTKVLASYRSVRNDTGYRLFFTHTGLCRHVEIAPLSPRHVLDAARLTLDYPADLEVFRRIIEALAPDGGVFSLDRMLDYLRENPDLTALNGAVSEEYDRRTRRLLDLEYADRDGTIRRVVY